ncbi:MAG: hypothetical protein EOP56_03750 [Sphingobacteriales bacterium]|nr:MAG: hypothetical protein EOP56_03750 [Sphingobacteriales bacterium]
MAFELLLTGEKVKPHQIIALHLMSALVFTGAGAVLYKMYPPTALWGMALMIFGALLLITSVFRSKWLKEDKVNMAVRIVELLISVAIVLFTFSKMWVAPMIIFSVLGATLLFALFWEKGQENKLAVKVDDEGIVLPPTARKRFIPWYEAEQVLLRYGTLTIEGVGNKHYQWTVAHIDFDNVDFEAFCQRQIEAGKNKRPKNDW